MNLQTEPYRASRIRTAITAITVIATLFATGVKAQSQDDADVQERRSEEWRQDARPLRQAGGIKLAETDDGRIQVQIGSNLFTLHTEESQASKDALTASKDRRLHKPDGSPADSEKSIVSNSRTESRAAAASNRLQRWFNQRPESLVRGPSGRTINDWLNRIPRRQQKPASTSVEIRDHSIMNMLDSSIPRAIDEPVDSDKLQRQSLRLLIDGKIRAAAASAYDGLLVAPPWTWNELRSNFSDADHYTRHYRKLQRKTKMDPKNAEAWFLLAYHESILGHWQEAHKALKFAQSLSEHEFPRTIVDRLTSSEPPSVEP